MDLSKKLFDFLSARLEMRRWKGYSPAKYGDYFISTAARAFIDGRCSREQIDVLGLPMEMSGSTDKILRWISTGLSDSHRNSINELYASVAKARRKPYHGKAKACADGAPQPDV